MRKRGPSWVGPFLIGAVGYSLLEILWRGFTHWTMAITGGSCMTAICWANRRLKGRNLWQRCLVGASIITAAEFLVGCLVNRKLHWQVWDYSEETYNLLGQVCLPFCLIWYALCIPVTLLSLRLNNR